MAYRSREPKTSTPRRPADTHSSRQRVRCERHLTKSPRSVPLWYEVSHDRSTSSSAGNPRTSEYRSVLVRSGHERPARIQGVRAPRSPRQPFPRVRQAHRHPSGPLARAFPIVTDRVDRTEPVTKSCRVTSSGNAVRTSHCRSPATNPTYDAQLERTVNPLNRNPASVNTVVGLRPRPVLSHEPLWSHIGEGPHGPPGRSPTSPYPSPHRSAPTTRPTSHQPRPRPRGDTGERPPGPPGRSPTSPHPSPHRSAPRPARPRPRHPRPLTRNHHQRAWCRVPSAAAQPKPLRPPR